MSEDENDKSYKSIAMAIIGAIITLIFGAMIIIGLIMNSHLSSTNPLYYRVSLIGLFLIFPIGITICIYGLYGIYKFKPVKYKEALEKRKKSENRRIIYYLLIAISLPILFYTFYYLISVIPYGIEYIFYNLHMLFLFIFFSGCVVFGIYRSIRKEEQNQAKH